MTKEHSQTSEVESSSQKPRFAITEEERVLLKLALAMDIRRFLSDKLIPRIKRDCQRFEDKLNRYNKRHSR